MAAFLKSAGWRQQAEL